VPQPVAGPVALGRATVLDRGAEREPRRDAFDASHRRLCLIRMDWHFLVCSLRARVSSGGVRSSPHADETSLHGFRHGIRPTRGAELLEQVTQMNLDRGLTDEERLADLPIGLPLGHLA
jgi:hypothetical protein